MKVAELKLKIFRQVDSLGKSQLEELHGVFTNYINSRNDINEWSKLSKEQQQGLFDAEKEIESGKGISHEKVMKNVRTRFINT
jgi:hypothetical protein